jgi:hypothetical protein
MCELAWNHFTHQVEPTDSAASDASDSNAPLYVLRPTYQRAGMVFMHLAFGGWVAFMIGMKSGMSVKRIWLTPRPRGNLTTVTRKPIERPKVANFEGFSGFGLRGDGLDVKYCHLSSAEPADDLTLTVNVPGNRQQLLSIATKGVHINGRPASREEVRTSLSQVFKRKSNVSPWRSGPIVDARVCLLTNNGPHSHFIHARSHDQIRGRLEPVVRSLALNV